MNLNSIKKGNNIKQTIFFKYIYFDVLNFNFYFSQDESYQFGFLMMGAVDIMIGWTIDMFR